MIFSLLFMIALLGNLPASHSHSHHKSEEVSVDAAYGRNATLVVAVNTLHPFAFQLEDGSWDGFSVQLFDSIAHQNGWQYELRAADSTADALAMVKAGDAELAFGGISITSARQRDLKFSFPIFETGLSIMVLKDQGWTFYEVIFSHQIWTATCLFVLSLVIAGHVLWLLEGSKNPAIGSNYFTAIPRAVWWAGVTISTVGYGDVVPTTKSGRVFSMLWMFLGMICVGFLSGSVSSQLTVATLHRGIRSPADLPGHLVATKNNSTAHYYLQRQGVTTRSVRMLAAAYSLLEDGSVDAVVFDSPTLLYYVVRDGLSRGFRLIESTFETQQYGVLCRNDQLADMIDVPLLRLREDYRYSALMTNWFGQNTAIYQNQRYDNESGDHTYNWLLYGTTLSMLVAILAMYYLRQYRVLDESWLGLAEEEKQRKSKEKRMARGMARRNKRDTARRRRPSGAPPDNEDSDEEFSDPAAIEPLSSSKRLDLITRRMYVLEQKLDVLMDRLENKAFQSAASTAKQSK